MTDHIIANPTAADYASAARVALNTGNITLAIEQVAAALARDPLFEPHLALLDCILSATKDPVAATTVRGEAFFGRLAVHAHALAGVGRLGEALHTLTQSVVFRPEVPYFEWLRRWSVNVDALARIDDETIARVAAEVVSSSLRVFDPLIGFLMATHHARRLGAHDRSLVYIAMLLRRSGAFDEAASLLVDHVRAAPSWDAHCEYARVLRAMDDVEGAISAMQRAIALQPDEPSGRIDVGEMLLEIGRFRDAAHVLEMTEHEEARLPLLYAHARVDADARRTLRARSEPRARLLADDLALFETLLPAPNDPCARVVRDLLARASRMASNQPIRARVRIDNPEPPSVHIAFRLGLARLGRTGELTFESNAPSRRPAAGRPPPPGTAAAVAALAARSFEIDGWFAAAAALPSDVASLMEHPPPPPPAFETTDWVQRVQVVAAMRLAHDERIWQVLDAESDWTVTAAIVALLSRARAFGDERVVAALDARLARTDDSAPETLAALVVRTSLDARCPPRLWLRRRALYPIAG